MELGSRQGRDVSPSRAGRASEVERGFPTRLYCLLLRHSADFIFESLGGWISKVTGCGNDEWGSIYGRTAILIFVQTGPGVQDWGGGTLELL